LPHQPGEPGEQDRANMCAAMDKAALFSAVLERNAFRRAALLPPLDVGLEFRRAVAGAAWQEYERRCSAEAEALARCRAEAVAECRKRFGPAFDPGNFGSRILVARETVRRFRKHMAKVLGTAPPVVPARHPVVYGSARGTPG
jgi:hypothetical protein